MEDGCNHLVFDLTLDGLRSTQKALRPSTVLGENGNDVGRELEKLKTMDGCLA